MTQRALARKSPLRNLSKAKLLQHHELRTLSYQTQIKKRFTARIAMLEVSVPLIQAKIRVLRISSISFTDGTTAAHVFGMQCHS